MLCMCYCTSGHGGVVTTVLYSTSVVTARFCRVTATTTINNPTIMCRWWDTHTYTWMHIFFPTIYLAWLGIFLLPLHPPTPIPHLSRQLSFPLSLTQHVVSPHMTIQLWALITSLLIAPSTFLLRPPLPALSQWCLYTMEPVDTITFHLETEIMCRCCYLLCDQKGIK